jgi:hypothetical protein
MRSINNKMKGSILLVATLMLSLGLYAYSRNGSWQNNAPTGTGQTLLLVRPVFAASASAATTFLEGEAGIALYVNTGQQLNLAVAGTTLHTTEYTTSTYIIGSIAVPTSPSGTLPDTEDPHCFVQKDGWIVVYYRNTEPISKIVDWNWWNQATLQLTNNKLQAALSKMCTALGVTTTGEQYYDFKYPGATEFLLVIKTRTSGGTSNFTLQIPNNFTYYEQSWSHYIYESGDYDSSLMIDSNPIDHNYARPPGGTLYAAFPILSPTSTPPLPLTANTPHAISVYSYYSYPTLNGVCIVIAYSES